MLSGSVSEEYLSPIDRLEAGQLANTSLVHAISVPEPSQISMHCLILSRLPGKGRVRPHTKSSRNPERMAEKQGASPEQN
jgi:hypothetical protein